MSNRILLVLLTTCLTFGMTLNYSKKIIETGNIQIEKAKKVVEQYNERNT